MSIATARTGGREDPNYGGNAAGIKQHYDVGNPFWHLMLGPSFTYSAALFASDDESLESAQDRKFEWHMNSAAVYRARSVLEVGCGWGPLLRRLAAKPNVERVVGLTLSEAQAVHLAAEAIPKTEVLVRSWSRYEPTEQFDSIISIGAFEHFARPGESLEQKAAMYRDFFSRCRRWLTPDGRMSLQTIAFGNMKRDEASEFMLREIYPDSDLPFLRDIVEAVDGLFEVVALRDDRFHYARSYDAWARNLRARRAEGVSMVGEEEVKRFERFFKLGSIGFRMGKMWLLRVALRPISTSWKHVGREDDPRILARLA